MDILTHSESLLDPHHSELLGNFLNCQTLEFKPITQDGSDRKYFRIFDKDPKHSYVLMVLGKEESLKLKNQNYDWLQLQTFLSKKNIRVPKVYTTLEDDGAILIEDCGNTMLENVVLEEELTDSKSRTHKIYKDAIKVLGKFLKLVPNNQYLWCHRSFDEEKYLYELNFFKEKFLNRICPLTPTEEALFTKECKKICAYLAGFSRYFTHRDFHSRNLMFSSEELVVIDFQDARLGCASYDLVSLLFDAYIPFTIESRTNLLHSAIEEIAKNRETPWDTIKEELEESWRPMLMQRQLKALGSFAYLTLDKKRGDYMQYAKVAISLLKNLDLGDERWAFLSNDLLGKLHLLNEAP